MVVTQLQLCQILKETMPNLKGNPNFKPKYGEPTKVVRLPESLATSVTDLLKQGSTTKEVLQQLESVSLLHRSQLPEIPAIYLVYQGERLLYIGRTKNLKQRWLTHHRYKQFAQLEDVRVAWFPCKEEVPEVEATLIELLEPELNGLDIGDRLQLNLRFDKYKDLYESIKAEAKQQNISVNQFVVDALKKTLGQETESIGSPEALKKLEVQLEERLVRRLVDLVDEKIEQVLAKQEIDLGESIA